VIAVIHPSTISGNIKAPASKSSMQRACAAALLSKGRSIIHNHGHSNDDKAAMEIVENLGAEVMINNEELIINSRGLQPTGQVNCGESGLSLRMFTPIAALSEKEITIHGEGSLLNRPIDFFDEILPRLDVRIQSNNGKLPVTVKGRLQPKNIEIDGSMSSQFLTGLLMAYSATDATDVSIKVKNLKSKPYIDLTLHVMKKFGLKLPENKNYEEFYFPASTHDSHPDDYRDTIHDYTVEADWSGGAFLLVAGCIAGAISVRGLDLSSTQADKKIMEALSDANASVAVEAKGIKVRSVEMRAFEFDATDCPDLFPPLVALAAYCKGQTRIRGVNRLKHKESDRATTLQQEFGKMGVKIEFSDDLMVVYGDGKLKGAKLHSQHDHRIAMACSIAALKADGNTTIEAAQAVNKSYPDFFEDLKNLGAGVESSLVY
jgi:3-phosphoshikimate 1-carboxyvinyltransferase